MVGNLLPCIQSVTYLVALRLEHSIFLFNGLSIVVCLLYVPPAVVDVVSYSFLTNIKTLNLLR